MITPDELVFGLDIGTRNVVGSVGYKEDKVFHVIAHSVKMHETRAMLDGQIHDIGRVGNTIRFIKEDLESQLGQQLSDVCIAAAGRVLKTVTTTVEHKFAEETIVTGEDIHTLDLLGIEQAQQVLAEENDTKYKFYCVGYSVVHYYLNDEMFTNLEGHKADTIAEDIIVTFLPEDVVDGLYSAVNLAGLEVVNLTLEPIAAINVAIPENFRMLNIALVDVGAGTSDISITKDGSIIAYGMIPHAGDELTELIVQQYLVDFNTAEEMKLASTFDETVEFKDIMGISHIIPSEEIWELTAPTVEKITSEVAEKIRELNGNKSVSAAFVVGGGGKIHGFTESLAEYLELPKERVALRGEEVLQAVKFEQESVKKDPLLVTPIGICLNYYDQKNNFIMVHFNGDRMKLYDNGHLTLVDAALNAGFPNEDLFPKRGKEINFTLNGKPRLIRGEAGESAVIRFNGKIVSINTPLEPNSYISITPSTAGEDATCTIEMLEEYNKDTIAFYVNKKLVSCPRLVEVNGEIQLPSYQIQDGDVIETRNYYTVGQLAEFMDLILDKNYDILVNNRVTDEDEPVYENFEVEWMVDEHPVFDTAAEESKETGADAEKAEAGVSADMEAAEPVKTVGTDAEKQDVPETDAVSKTDQEKADTAEAEEDGAELAAPLFPTDLSVIVNGRPVLLQGKPVYVFVDVFEHIKFDLNAGNGRPIVTKINGVDARFTQQLHSGDRIEIYWKEN